MGNVLCCVDSKRDYADGECEDYGELHQDTSLGSQIKAVLKHPIDIIDNVLIVKI